ncbi:MAG: hypothetical protein ACK55I_32240, partial [bacterium]
GRTGDQAPLDAHRGQAPIRSPGLEHDRGGHADDRVGDADEEEGLEAGVGGLRPHGHVATSLVQDDPVDPPGDDRQEGVDQPGVAGGGRRGSRIHRGDRLRSTPAVGNRRGGPGRGRPS